MKFIERHKITLSIATICLTICGCIIFYNYTSIPAYSICVDDKAICYVYNKEQYEALNKEVNKDFSDRFGLKDIKSKLTVNKVRVKEEDLDNGDVEGIKKLVYKEMNIFVNATVMKFDSNEVAVVASEQEANSVVENLKKIYVNQNKNGKAIDCVINNKITYEKRRVPAVFLQNLEEISKIIVKKNSELQGKLVNYYVRATVEAKETILPPTTIKNSDTIVKGQRKVSSEGASGEKLVYKEVEIKDNKIIAEKKIGEKIIKAPVEKIIINGTKAPKVVAASIANLPSRGIISSYFGERWGKSHNGIDIASVVGSPIYAAFDGVVKEVGYEADGYGNFVEIQHSNGVLTLYGHCSKLEVSHGEKVSKGTEIAKVGNTGRSTGPHLHFEVRLNGKAVNPLQYLR